MRVRCAGRTGRRRRRSSSSCARWRSRSGAGSTPRLHGNYQGITPGHGSEPGESRPYQPGDDVRRIDWNVTARTGETHVRDQIADRDLEAWLVVDVSAAMRFGTATLEKAQVALAAAACVGFLTVRNKNRIGAALVAGPHIKLMPPRFGRDQVRAILTSIASPPPSEHLGRSDLGGAIDRVDRLSRRRGFVCVIADFAGDGWADPLTRLGMRNDLLAIPIHDPRERDVPPIGLVSLVDAGDRRRPRGARHRRRAAALRRGRGGPGRAAARRPAPGRRRRHRVAHRQRLARGDHPARPPAPCPGRQRPGVAPSDAIRSSSSRSGCGCSSSSPPSPSPTSPCCAGAGPPRCASPPSTCSTRSCHADRSGAATSSPCCSCSASPPA